MPSDGQLRDTTDPSKQVRPVFPREVWIGSKPISPWGEVELFIIGRIVGGYASCDTFGNASVTIKNDGGIMIESRSTFLK